MELTQRLAEIQKALADQRTERHQMNSQLATTLYSLTNRQLASDDAVTSMRGDMAQVVKTSHETASAVRLLSDRLLGNPALQTVGVIQEMNAYGAKVAALEQNMERINNRILGGFLTITGLGALITWLQAQFKWPFGGGTP